MSVVNRSIRCMTTAQTPLPLPTLLAEWDRHLRTVGRSPATVTSYLHVAGSFVHWLDQFGHSCDARDVELADCEQYLLDVRERTSASNQVKHYRSLRQLWRWLVDVEDELAVSPMAKLEQPKTPVKPVPVIPDEQLTALLAACAGRDFLDRRDAAMIRVLAGTGMRAGELLGLTVDGADELSRPTGLDWQYDVAHVIGKGNRPRACPFGDETGAALRRYLRARTMHRDAGSAALWLGKRGPLAHDGLAQLLEHRCEIAGIPPINPHRFRHTFAHVWLSSGGQETDLMRLMGWRSRDMLARYAQSAADQRAHAAYRRLSVRDRF